MVGESSQQVLDTRIIFPIRVRACKAGQVVRYPALSQQFNALGLVFVAWPG
jgi:hypothetical protein